jgi:hypothetical protein
LQAFLFPYFFLQYQSLIQALPLHQGLEEGSLHFKEDKITSRIGSSE